MSDEEMNTHFRHLDGKWSYQTIHYMREMGASGLDLNSNWALTDPSWICPACLRPKRDIFRKLQNDVLVAKLELHHDHLHDFDSPAASLLLRFERTLVCQDCNSADGEAKKKLRNKIDKYFSFSPSEIREFCDIGRWRSHKVDVRKALQIWEAKKEDFYARLTICYHFEVAVSTVGIQTEKTGHSAANNRSLLPSEHIHRAFRNQHEDNAKTKALFNVESEFISKSISNDSSYLSKKAASHYDGPSDAEYAAYNDVNNEAVWGAVPDTWCCPHCRRTKRETVRLSNYGKWRGGVRRASVIQGVLHLENAMCSDCSEVAGDLQRRKPDTNGYRLQDVDLRQVLKKITPHGKHEVDWELAYKIVSDAKSKAMHL